VWCLSPCDNSQFIMLNRKFHYFSMADFIKTQQKNHVVLLVIYNHCEFSADTIEYTNICSCYIIRLECMCIEVCQGNILARKVKNNIQTAHVASRI
jgi:hypothetical protein